MKVLCIHHTDLDGAMSGAIVGLYCHLGNHQVTYKYHNYGYPLKIGDLSGYDVIYAVDISFQDYPWVYDLSNLVWIDHHKTAIEYEANNIKRNIPGIRRNGVAACELCWEYLFPQIPCPELIKYLSTYDVWDKKRYQWKDVERIEYGVKLEFGVSSVNLCNYLKGASTDKRNFDYFLRKGKDLLDYLEKTFKSKLYNNGFYSPNFLGTGYRALILNTLDFSSKSFEGYEGNDIDILVPFSIASGIEPIIRVSIYTENPMIDCSGIAKSYGGGGHKGAAGFTLPLTELSNILYNTIPLKK